MQKLFGENNVAVLGCFERLHVMRLQSIYYTNPCTLLLNSHRKLSKFRRNRLPLGPNENWHNNLRFNWKSNMARVHVTRTTNNKRFQRSRMPTAFAVFFLLPLPSISSIFFLQLRLFPFVQVFLSCSCSDAESELIFCCVLFLSCICSSGCSKVL